jgi:hypothetical protein
MALIYQKTRLSVSVNANMLEALVGVMDWIEGKWVECHQINLKLDLASISGQLYFISRFPLIPRPHPLVHLEFIFMSI